MSGIIGRIVEFHITNEKPGYDPYVTHQGEVVDVYNRDVVKTSREYRTHVYKAEGSYRFLAVMDTEGNVYELKYSDITILN